MVRTGLKKSRAGCQRCKERKVKCDEQKPRCSACVRHHATCDYAEIPPRKSNLRPDLSKPSGQRDVEGSQQLELRLMHQWTAFTSTTFSPKPKYWRERVPLLALKEQSLLYAVFAVTALHLAQPEADDSVKTSWLNGGDSAEQGQDGVSMLSYATFYFQLASEHFQARSIAKTPTTQVASTTAFLLCLSSLARLGRDELDPVPWLRLGSELKNQYGHIQDRGELDEFNLALGLAAGESLQSNKLHRGDTIPFKVLLTHNVIAEDITPEDELAYRQALLFSSNVFMSIVFGQSTPVEIAQQLMLFPAHISTRFTALVEEQRPRALVILAHMFANMQMVSNEVTWLKDIANRQVKRTASLIPDAWQERMSWPLMLLEGNIAHMPRQAIDSEGFPFSLFKSGS